MRLLSTTVALVVMMTAAPHPSTSAASLPKLGVPVQHVVIIVEENRTFGEIIGSKHAPYINELARDGAVFTNSHGVTHPSQPNYFALFAGQVDRNGDGCPARGISNAAPNIASELLASNRTFIGYAESMPRTGFTGCWAGTYARKHTPWVHFSNVPASLSRPFSELKSYDDLPTVTMIIPNLDHDMHDGSIAAGDAWLEKNIAPLLAWGESHGLLLVLTWDEGFDPTNHIPTIFYGPMVKPGRYRERINDYNVLRTIEEQLGLQPTAKATAAKAITDCWR
jgi:hypothetical protein